MEMSSFTVDGKVAKDANGKEVFESATLPLIPVQEREGDVVKTVWKPNSYDMREHAYDNEYEEVVVENATLELYSNRGGIVAPVDHSPVSYDEGGFYLIEYNGTPNLFRVVDANHYPAPHPLGGGRKVEVGFMSTDKTFLMDDDEFNEFFNNNVIAYVTPVFWNPW